MNTENSIIIPFHKNKNMLDLSLKTLRESISANDSVEIIIVANNLDEKEIDIKINDISGHTPKIIQITENLFYPKAINMGVKYALGKYLIFCDPDIFYAENWLSALKTPFFTNQKTGCVGAKLLNPLTNKILDYGIGYHGYHRCHIFRGLPYNHELVQSNISVSSVCSALMCVEKKVFEQVGGIDEEMPYAFCDNDFTLKVLKLGYENCVAHNAIAYHKSHTDNNNSKYYAFKHLREDSIAAFFSKNKNIPNDYFRHLLNFWNWHIEKYGIKKQGFILVNLSTAYDWDSYIQIISELKLELYEKYSFVIPERNIPSLILTDILPNYFIGIHTPILYFVDNFTCLSNNSLWFSLRNIAHDIVIDRDANVVSMQHVAKMLL